MEQERSEGSRGVTSIANRNRREHPVKFIPIARLNRADVDARTQPVCKTPHAGEEQNDPDRPARLPQPPPHGRNERASDEQRGEQPPRAEYHDGDLVGRRATGEREHHAQPHRAAEPCRAGRLERKLPVGVDIRVTRQCTSRSFVVEQSHAEL